MLGFEVRCGLHSCLLTLDDMVICYCFPLIYKLAESVVLSNCQLVSLIMVTKIKFLDIFDFLQFVCFDFEIAGVLLCPLVVLHASFGCAYIPFDLYPVLEEG